MQRPKFEFSLPLTLYLRWPGYELFLMGRLAALQVGLTARNLLGARIASEKTLFAIIKQSITHRCALSVAMLEALRNSY